MTDKTHHTQIIAVIQDKGGAGKSTILRCIAGWLAKDGARVAIIDTDPQQSCLKWVAKKEIGVDGYEETNDELLGPTIRQLRPDYDVILIDTAGYKSAMAIHAILNADLILIPTKADEDDAMGALKTWNHVLSLAEHKANEGKVQIVYTGVDKNASITDSIRNAIKEQEAPMLDHPLWHRTGFKEMISLGGLPTGAALKALTEFMASIQLAGLIDFYNQKGE